MVVEDWANTAPITKAAAPGSPASQVMQPTSNVVNTTCPVPSPRIWWRSACNWGREKLSPMVNSRKTMPNSESVANSGIETVGPIV